MKLDDRDITLLAILQSDARVSLNHLAEEAGLSLASLQRRLKRLRENKVIAAEVAIVSPHAVGPLMTFIVSVDLERDSPEHLAQFKTKMKRESRIQQCYFVTGEADFILVVIAKSVEDFDAHLQHLFANDSNVKRYKTSVVMDSSKTSLELPLKDLE